MKTIAIMQPYFFPYIGYFQLINAVDTFVVYDDVNFIKQGWIARNKILLNGHEHMFTLQLNGASSFKQIKEVKVGGNSLKLLKTIQQAYCNAPYYDACFPVIRQILENEQKHLSVFLYDQLRYLCDYLSIDTQFVLSSSFAKDPSKKGQEKVLDICKILGASTYINSYGGKALYDKTAFAEHNVKLSFIKPREITYQQFNEPFVPWLTIIDLMMFNTVAEIRQFLYDFELDCFATVSEEGENERNF